MRIRPAPVIIAGGLAGSAFGLGALGVVQVLDPATTATIATTIQRVEGYYPGTLAYQNNNPGNLVYVGQAGATPGAGGFAKFASYDAGWQALLNQIQLYAARGLTISDMMHIYAPASDGNDPNGYAGQIAAALGVTPDTSLLALAGFPPAGQAPGILENGAPGVDLASLLDFSTWSPAAIAAAVLIGAVLVHEAVS